MSASIEVFVNAGDKAVRFQRTDNQEWARPLYVNVPNGGRETLVKALAKHDGKAQRNIRWNLPIDMVKSEVIKTGPNAGSAINVVELRDCWAEFLGSITVENRGSVAPEVQAVNDAFLASLPPLPEQDLLGDSELPL